MWMRITTLKLLEAPCIQYYACVGVGYGKAIFFKEVTERYMHTVKKIFA